MKDIIPSESKFERVARFQALQAGHYWRAVKQIPESAIDLGETLLIESIKWIDSSPHTIVVRAHPSKFGKSINVKVVESDGSIRDRWVQAGTHRFLLRDFLASFEFEPGHQAIRDKEIQAVHSHINDLQRELIEGQANPAFMTQIAHEKLAEHEASELRKAGASQVEIDAALTQSSSNQSQALVLATGSIAAAIGTGITEQKITELRASVERESRLAQYKADWISKKTTQISETIKALTPYFNEHAAAALAHTEDVRKQVDKLMKGIASLDLYVGTGVTVETICKGSSAPSDVPLTLVQKKLMVDEELAIHTNLDEWFDFRNIDLFFDALQNNQSLIEQIFPTERCVLVMATTRRYIDYGDGQTNRIFNDKNSCVFLMVRDGENIHRVISPVESHLGAARLFPSHDDHDNLFKGIDGSEITFDDVRYSDHLVKHEAYALHYKRVLILLCGLDHRLKLFGEFYDGPPSLHFVSLAFQESHCRFLHDDDGAGLLPGEERQPMHQWIMEKNQYLRSGSRVLCCWDSVMNPDTAPGACKEDGSSRSSYGFERPYRPSNERDIVVAFREGNSMCVNIEVQGFSYSRRQDRTFNCKVNLSEAASSRWSRNTELPYLCLDAVTPNELYWYIHHRETRSDHVLYIRIFKEALRHLLRDRRQERDTRLRMQQALIDGAIATGLKAQQVIDQAVMGWRAANRGKPLPEFVGTTAPKGWKQLLDQMYVLAGEGQQQIENLSEFISGLGYTPLRLILTGNAQRMVYAAPLPDECDNRAEAHPWVHLIQVEPTVNGYAEKSRRWTLMPKAAASETVLHEWESAEAWAGRTSAFKSYEYKQRIFSLVEQAGQRIKGLLSPSPTAFAELVEEWTDARSDASEKSEYVNRPMILIPIGVVRNGQSFAFITLERDTAMGQLYNSAPTSDLRDMLEPIYLGLYENKENAAKRFQGEATEVNPWKLSAADANLLNSDYGLFMAPQLGVVSHTLDGYKRRDLSLGAWLCRYRDLIEKKRGEIWISEDIPLDEGVALNKMLGEQVPDAPSQAIVRRITAHMRDGKTARWYDLYSAVQHPEPDSLADAQSYNSMSFAHETFWSIEDARKYIASQGKKEALCVSTEIPGYPKTPDGIIERWCVVAEPAAS